MSMIDSKVISDAEQLIKKIDPLPGSVARIAVKEKLLGSQKPVSVA